MNQQIKNKLDSLFLAASPSPEADTADEVKLAMRVSVISVVVNLALSIFKLLAGIIAHSGAMISDAVHSASDVFSTFVVMAGVNISAKKADKEHPYGHDRMECVAAIVLAVILFATGLGIGYGGIQKIFFADPGELKIPGTLALAAAVISIATKEWMYRFTKKAADSINSGALMADAWHHRSDALSSVGALIGIGGAKLGLPVLDPIASVVICLFILKAAVEIFKDAVDKMVDKSCDEQTVAQMRSLISSQNGVLGISRLKTRMFGSKIYVDAEIEADGALTLTEAHNIAQEVHDSIEEEFRSVKHCMVHVNPFNER